MSSEPEPGQDGWLETIIGKSKRITDVSEEYPWPWRFSPTTGLVVYLYNEVKIHGVTAEAIFDKIANTSKWSECQPDTVDYSDMVIEHAAPGAKPEYLAEGARFSYTSTYKLPINGVVKEFVPGRRIAWDYTAARRVVVKGYRTWTILPLADGTGYKLITEEAQRGAVPILGRFYVHPTLSASYQVWLDGIKKACEEEAAQG